MSQWASENYPLAWEEVKKLSKRKRHGNEYPYDGGMVYNINRDIRA